MLLYPGPYSAHASQESNPGKGTVDPQRALQGLGASFRESQTGPGGGVTGRHTRQADRAGVGFKPPRMNPHVGVFYSAAAPGSRRFLFL